MGDDIDILYALRHPDGAVSLYVDEAWAAERGVDPARLVRVEIPGELYRTGTVQELREYVATLLEARAEGSA
jgi:hypothetical protein